MKRDYLEFQERWTAEHIGTAVEYVVSGHGGELPKFDLMSGLAAGALLYSRPTDTLNELL